LRRPFLGVSRRLLRHLSRLRQRFGHLLDFTRLFRAAQADFVHQREDRITNMRRRSYYCMLVLSRRAVAGYDSLHGSEFGS
jgi:hypothetical protein